MSPQHKACTGIAASLWLMSPVIRASLSVTVPSTERDVTHVCHMTNAFLIDLYDPRGIPLKPNLVSFSKLNLCSSSLIAVTKEQYWCIYTGVMSEFSAGCAGEERCLL